MHRGYRFRLYPTAAQAETLVQWVGVTRLVYNLALEQRRDFWRQFQAANGRSINIASQGRELTALRAEFDWIAAVPQTALEAALNDLEVAFARFFKGTAKYPTPRRLGLNDSIRFRGREVAVKNLNAKWAVARIPKMGLVKFRITRPIKDVAHVTLTRDSTGWSIAFACRVEAAQGVNNLPATGIDRGVANAISLADGTHIRLPDISDLEQRRKQAQRSLSRKRRGSARYGKQRRRIARIAAKIGRVRSHHLHVASTGICRRFGVVALENLNVRAMTASAKGTASAPGRNIRQKAGLNRSILAQGWTRFATMLDYKLEAAGGRLVYVPAPFTSQTCAECGVVDARSRKSQAVFECVACGHADHADTNAARNIMRGSTALVEEGRHFRPSDEAITLAA